MIGGHDGSVDEYDPSTDTWTTKTAMNVMRNYATGVVLGDLIYAIGGLIIIDNSAPNVATVEIYDPRKDQ